MKSTILSIAAGVLAMAVSLPAQTPKAAGRAYGDKNNDGICDYTGRQVGQGYGRMGAGMGRGRMAAGRGRGWGGRCPRMAQSQAPVQAAPVQAAPAAPAKK